MTTLAELKLLCQVRGAKELWAENAFDRQMLCQVADDARAELARPASLPPDLVQGWNPKGKSWTLIDRANGKILGSSEERFDVPVSGPEPKEETS